MSDLYKEALLDAKKLKEVAEIDAKNRIMEQISPVVKEMISKEIKKNVLTENFFTEQEEEPVQMDQGEMSSPMDSQEPMPVTDPGQELNAELGNQPSNPDAPITPSGTDLMNMTVPDADGKIVVDFDDLFSGEKNVAATPSPESMDAPPPNEQGPEVSADFPAAPEAELMPPPDGTEGPQLQPESVQYNNFKIGLLEVSEKIDRIYFRNKPVSSISEGTLKNKLFSLMEQLDSLKEKGNITIKESKLNENKLDFLYTKLKEAVLNNSYNKTQEENNNMASLKEFAAQLFEEDEKLDLAKDSVSSGETGVRVDKPKSDHAKEQSGVSPMVGGPKDLGVASEKTFSEEVNPGVGGTVDESPISDKEPGEKHWSDAEPPLKENSADANTDANEDVAHGAAGFGDTNDDPAVEFEIDEKELMEAIRSIRKENVKKKVAKLKENSEGPDTKVIDKKDTSWEDADPEGGKEPSLKHLEEQLEMLAAEEEDEDDMIDLGSSDDEVLDVSSDDEMDMDMGDDGADLMLSVDLPDELEAMLADFGSEDFGVDVELGLGGEEDVVDVDLGGDVDDVEVVDVGSDVSMGGEEEDDLLMDDEIMPESKQLKALKNKLRLTEASLRKARKLLEQRNAEKSQLEEQLQETNLFTAKAVYLNKFLMGEGLSKKVQRQIVECLDKASTIAEAKMVYSKIKTRLNESAATSQKLVGSSSKVAKPGSVKLNENSQPEQKTQKQEENPVFDTSRWKQLANIK